MEPQKNLILGISASPRNRGNTEIILEQILAGAEQAGAKTRAFNLAKLNVQPCLGCERCRKQKACTRLIDDMQQIYPILEEAKGLVLGSPVHNYNLTSWAKAFIDRLYCYYDFTDTRPRDYKSRLAGQGREALVYAIGEQPDPREAGITLKALSMPLTPLGYNVTELPPFMGFFDKGAIKAENDLMQKAFTEGQKLASRLAG
jgi:multimeric flavodoxin WrbA